MAQLFRRPLQQRIFEFVVARNIVSRVEEIHPVTHEKLFFASVLCNNYRFFLLACFDVMTFVVIMICVLEIAPSGGK